MALKREPEKILVVDDSEATLEVLQRNLISEGYRVFTAVNVPKALALLNNTDIDLVITDLKMPGTSGLELVKHVRENNKQTEVMMITGYASVESAVEAVKNGAAEYLPKPFTDEELFKAVRKILDKLNDRKKGLDERLQKVRAPHGLLGDSPAMRNIYDAITKAAATTATVLITGESGTGKELVARAIHYTSARAAAPFVPVNCGGIPEALLESELFGFVKGAFTGATESRAGFFQTADGGSIFLDEISETSTAMQVKLLRVLQDKEFFMIGDKKAKNVDVRIIAATNKNLLKLVKKNFFREDLYFRLNVLVIDIPPLREREDDIILLAYYFAKKFAKELGKPIPRISDNAVQSLKNYDWPGNVRELENLIHRLIVMNDSQIIESSDLPSSMRFKSASTFGFDRTFAEIEVEYICNVLNSVNGNKTRAAEILGIDRKTLREKLKSLLEQQQVDDEE